MKPSFENLAHPSNPSPGCYGVGDGASLLTVPLLLSENARGAGHRGKLVTLFQTGVVLGVACPYALQLAVGSWRATLVSGGIPGIIGIAAMLALGAQGESRAWREERQISGWKGRAAGGGGGGDRSSSGGAIGSVERGEGPSGDGQRGARSGASTVPPRSLSPSTPTSAAILGAAAITEEESSGKRAAAALSMNAPLRPLHPLHPPLHATLPSPLPHSTRPRTSAIPVVCSVRILLGVVLAFTNNSSDALVFYGPDIVAAAGFG